MDRPRLALLNAAHSWRATSRNFRRELDADLAEFRVTQGELPTGAYDQYDGVVITGSASSAYWDEPWIHDTREWVAGAHEAGLPVLGVCFGHQLLAAALGGTVEAMADREGVGDYEIGYRAVRRTADDETAPVLAGLDDSFTAFTTHGDAVTALPEGATLLAENEYGVHGFRVGHAFGLQFHPEYDMATAREVTRGKEFLDDERVASVLDGITDENYARACETKRLFDNFTAYVDTVRAERTAQAD